MSHRVVQLSDTHFLADGEEPEGGFAYDTDEAFEAVRADIAALDGPAIDFVAVTGDIADHGRIDQYQKAAAAFAQLGLPINACPGNHDQHAHFPAVARTTIATSRVLHIDNWCHLFVDSNAGILETDQSGNLVDPADYSERLHINGNLGAREAAWIREQAAATRADHLFIWLHHPPAPRAPFSADDGYEAEWVPVVAELSGLRGIAGGHTHVPGDYLFGGVPVFMAPSLKNNFDLEARTLLPPGYRTFDFGDEGQVTSQLRFTDDERWPRLPYGRAVHGLMTGELTWNEFVAIVARKQAG